MVAAIRAVPLVCDMTLPAAVTVATSGFDDVNDGISAVILGLRVYRNLRLAFCRIFMDLRLNLTLVALGETKILQVRVVVLLLKNRNPFSFIFTVIVAFPMDSPVHLRLFSSSPEEIDTIELSLLLKETSSSVTPSIVSVELSFRSRSSEIIFNEYLEEVSVLRRLDLAAETEVVFVNRDTNSSKAKTWNLFALCINITMPFCLGRMICSTHIFILHYQHKGDTWQKHGII